MDPVPVHHRQRTADLVEAEARVLGCAEEEIETFRLAGMLHDIGKVGIPVEILQKTTSLTTDEWEIMKQHPQMGVEILAPVAKFGPILPIVKAHHEKFDGSGYPFGLKGEEILLGARILSVADAFSTMTAGRIYRPAMPKVEAIAELKCCRGSHFDPQIVDTFIEYIERKP